MIERFGLLLPRRLALACLIVAGITGLELIWAEIDPIPEASSIQLPSRRSGDAPTPTVFQFPASAEFDEISTRPVFAPDRKPMLDLDIVDNSASPISAPSLTITGIAGTGDRRYFVVRRDASPRLAPMRVGDQIDGWRVAAIAANDVTLTNGVATAQYGLGDAAAVVTSRPSNGGAVRSTRVVPSELSDDGFSSFGRRYPTTPRRSSLPTGFHGFGWGIP